jgi:hypothetical protein
MEELLPEGAQQLAIALTALLLRAIVGLSSYSGAKMGLDLGPILNFDLERQWASEQRAGRSELHSATAPAPQLPDCLWQPGMRRAHPTELPLARMECVPPPASAAHNAAAHPPCPGCRRGYAAQVWGLRGTAALDGDNDQPAAHAVVRVAGSSPGLNRTHPLRPHSPSLTLAMHTRAQPPSRHHAHPLPPLRAPHPRASPRTGRCTRPISSCLPPVHPPPATEGPTSFPLG